MTGDTYLQLLHELPCAAAFLIEGKRIKCEVVHHIRRKPANLEHFFGVPLLEKYHSPYSATGLHKLQRRGFERIFKIDEMDLLAATARLMAEYLSK